MRHENAHAERIHLHAGEAETSGAMIIANAHSSDVTSALYASYSSANWPLPISPLPMSVPPPLLKQVVEARVELVQLRLDVGQKKSVSHHHNHSSPHR